MEVGNSGLRVSYDAKGSAEVLVDIQRESEINDIFDHLHKSCYKLVKIASQ